MDIDPKIFKAYDIRGIYPTDLDEAKGAQIAKAIYTFFQKKLNKDQITVALGWDMRVSSPSMVESVRKALLEAGAHVVNLGLVSTPTFYFAVSHFGYETGITVTASHNPKEYTGMKFVINTPKGLLKIGKPTGMEDVRDLALQGVNPPKKEGTEEDQSDITQAEVQNALNLLGNPTLKQFKIVADPANAMGIPYLNALASKLPIDLVKMNFDLDGTFPVHQPDPMQPKNLVYAQKKLQEVNADLGLVPDGDGDRLFILDEKGDVVSPSVITSMIAKELFKEFPKSKVVVDAKYSLTVKKNVEAWGGEVLISKTGHAFITELMTNSGALMAGEASAHYYYNATGNAESQVITIIAVMKILTEENKPLSEVAKEYQSAFESGEINFAVTNAQEIMDHIKSTYHDGEFSDLDGVIISYPDWRMSLRTSNTEPLLRFNLEALTRDTMEQKRDEVISLIKSVAKEDVSHASH
ncbi:MAG: phosphomannomutase/phosphoglucomutase [Candidatus Levybacteria bacterium]|nr:phosphomannomutase/phosphoglucomutase [Candidatus Levybacteria bacterium]